MISELVEGKILCPLCKNIILTVMLEEHIFNKHDYDGLSTLAAWIYKSNRRITTLKAKLKDRNITCDNCLVEEVIARIEEHEMMVQP